MSSAPKKQEFLHGAAILTLGALLAKVVGALFKIPLTRIIGTEGAGHFNVAYNIYIVLLNVSTSGLPLAVSRLISQAHTLGQRQLVQRIHRISLVLFLILGGVCSGFMFFGAKALAVWMRDADAACAIATLAPAVLFVCVCGSFRGYFQGQQYMTPTAVAQVLEALSKLLLGLAAVWFAMNAGWSVPQAAGAAILGVTVGTMLSSLFFLWQYRRRPPATVDAHGEMPLPPAMETVGQIIRLAVPITIGATGLQIFNALGSRIIFGRLQDALGYDLAQASSLYGIYSMAQTLYLLPSALVQPLTVSIIPAVTEALALNRQEEARRKEESSLRIAGLIALPAGVGLSILSGPIQKLLYAYDPETLAVAEPTLAILGIASVFYCLILVTNAILQAHGKPGYAVWATVVGGVSNLAVTGALVSNPGVHILGAAVGTLVYSVAALGCNLFFIRKLVAQSPRFLPQVGKTAVAAGIMGCAASGLFCLTANTLVAIGGAGCVYLALVWVLKILTWYDCRSLPKGTHIARLLGIRPESP